MKTLSILLLVASVASLSGCAAFCDSTDYGCINKQHAIAAGIAAGSAAVLAGAAAYAATRPVYVEPVPVYVCRWPYC